MASRSVVFRVLLRGLLVALVAALAKVGLPLVRTALKPPPPLPPPAPTKKRVRQQLPPLIERPTLVHVAVPAGAAIVISTLLALLLADTFTRALLEAILAILLIATTVGVLLACFAAPLPAAEDSDEEQDGVKPPGAAAIDRLLYFENAGWKPEGESSRVVLASWTPPGSAYTAVRGITELTVEAATQQEAVARVGWLLAADACKGLLYPMKLYNKSKLLHADLDHAVLWQTTKAGPGSSTPGDSIVIKAGSVRDGVFRICETAAAPELEATYNSKCPTGTYDRSSDGKMLGFVVSPCDEKDSKVVVKVSVFMHVELTKVPRVVPKALVQKIVQQIPAAILGTLRTMVEAKMAPNVLRIATEGDDLQKIDMEGEPREVSKPLASWFGSLFAEVPSSSDRQEAHPNSPGDGEPVIQAAEPGDPEIDRAGDKLVARALSLSSDTAGWEEVKDGDYITSHRSVPASKWPMSRCSVTIKDLPDVVATARLLSAAWNAHSCRLLYAPTGYERCRSLETSSGGEVVWVGGGLNELGFRSDNLSVSTVRVSPAFDGHGIRIVSAAGAAPPAEARARVVPTGYTRNVLHHRSLVAEIRENSLTLTCIIHIEICGLPFWLPTFLIKPGVIDAPKTCIQTILALVTVGMIPREISHIGGEPVAGEADVGESLSISIGQKRFSCSRLIAGALVI